MKLNRVIIKGFRSYGAKTEIDISRLTAFIGENDVGKTSVLEALDAFFNRTIEPQDFNNRKKTISVGCIFSDVPKRIFLKKRLHMSLKKEKILNVDGNLEIYKEWTKIGNDVSLDRVYVRTYTPTKGDLRDLIRKNKRELVGIMKKNGIPVRTRETTVMRRLIYDHFENNNTSNSAFQNVDVDVFGRGSRLRFPPDMLTMYRSLTQQYFPLYTLFKAEQIHEKRETEINSALEIFLKSELRKFNKDLSYIQSKIIESVSERTRHALDRIKEDYPSVLLNIHPSYDDPDWSKAFSLEELQSDDDIPFGKRGSGLRRIAMLAFFQDEANRKRQDRDKIDERHEVPVIYAIEEPEISQHPNLLRNVIKVLKDLSDAGDQVILTTHIPDIMKLLPENSIRFIDRIAGKSTPRVRPITNRNNVLEKISENIGFHSTVPIASNTQAIVWTEGITDIWILSEFALILCNAGRFPKNLDLNRILFDPMGGFGYLKHKLSIDYYKHIKAPHFYLVDSDRSSKTCKGEPIPDDLKERARRWKDTREGVPIDYARTRKREIENYIHKDAIENAYGNRIDWRTIDGEFDWDFGKVCNGGSDNISLWQIMNENGVSFQNMNSKNVISKVIVKSMTYDNIVERCASTDTKSSRMCEVEMWFHKIAKLVTDGP